jgi:hypothetical protein
MLPSLILVDFAVTLFYLKKGFISAKIKANLDILKNRKIISKNYKDIQKNRIVNDDNLIKEFSNEIEIPQWVIGKDDNNFLNKVFEKLSNFSRIVFK